MQHPVHLLMRSALRTARRSAVLVAIPAVLILGAGGVALADGTSVRAESDAVTFGLLGPVGLVAVALGILGMTAGVVRQRRKARAAGAVTPPAPVQPIREVVAKVVVTDDQPARPQLRHP